MTPTAPTAAQADFRRRLPRTTLGVVMTLLMAHSIAAAQDATPSTRPATALVVGEGFVNPLGFHDAKPVFSWKLPDGVKHQTAYRIEAAAGNDTWDSGWVRSDQSTFVAYAGRPLGSRERVTWRVDYQDESGKAGGWSEPASLEIGLLTSADWTAKWVRPQKSVGRKDEAVMSLRRAFTLDKPVASARLYVTARGVFETRLNGQRVGHDHFANGYTSYSHRFDTLTYDVTTLLKPGENDWSAMVAKGWYAGRLGFENKGGVYGNDPALLAQLEVRYADGTTNVVTTDGQWQATWDGPIRSSGFYDGETVDAREPVGNWQPVVAEPGLGKPALAPKPFPPVRETQTLAVKKITEPQPGRFVFDLGQNMVGWARLNIPVEKDKTVTVRFAEMLNDDGTPYTANYRSAKCSDAYTAAATGTVEWEPHFTFRGFRYVELSGLPAGTRPGPGFVTGVVLHSDLVPTGRFTSSHAKLNQLQSNITWGQRGNFVDIPTDCPQRDERLGWTGDAQVFCATSMFNYDSHAFWKSWLRSVRDDQAADGNIPLVIPMAGFGVGCPGWNDCATIVPWEVYVRTGDTAMLADNYAMMEKFVGWYRDHAKEGFSPDQWFVGDWLQPYAPKNDGETTKTLIGAAFHAYSTDLLARSARALGKTDDARKYGDEAAALKKAFADKYLDARGRIQNATETQTSYLLAVAFDCVPTGLKDKVYANLVRTVHEADDHLRTGFLGTPFIVRVLDDAGQSDLAMKVLLNETYPSWFYSINQGATTMWERWNSYSHEHGFGNVEMNSFNHYAYGAIGQWLYERLAGLTPDAASPGYKHFVVRPLVTGPVTSARAELETPYGRAVSAWVRTGTQVSMDVVVPPNTTATVKFPDGRPDETAEAGEHHFDCAVGR